MNIYDVHVYLVQWHLILRFAPEITNLVVRQPLFVVHNDAHDLLYLHGYSSAVRPEDMISRQDCQIFLKW